MLILRLSLCIFLLLNNKTMADDAICASVKQSGIPLTIHKTLIIKKESGEIEKKSAAFLLVRNSDGSHLETTDFNTSKFHRYYLPSGLQERSESVANGILTKIDSAIYGSSVDTFDVLTEFSLDVSVNEHAKGRVVSGRFVFKPGESKTVTISGCSFECKEHTKAYYVDTSKNPKYIINSCMSKELRIPIITNGKTFVDSNSGHTIDVYEMVSSFDLGG